MNLYQYDQSFRNKGLKIIAGIDEAGRGPLAGPVVAAAVILPECLQIDGLRDSKKVPAKEREYLFREILCCATQIGVGIVDHEEIDRINILNATKLAMQHAVNDLPILPDFLIIDAVTLPSVRIRQTSPAKGETKSASVAAASIVAKYVRDMFMEKYDELYPQYHFRKHKGYGTAEHLDMIRVHGPCRIHRKSFNGVRSVRMSFDLPADC